MAKVKTENYSTDETATIVERYSSCGVEITESAHDTRKAMVKELAKQFSRKDRSIISKLVAEKVYIARAKVSGVTGVKPEKKEVIAQRMVDASGLGLNAESMAKANKVDLQVLLDYFNAQVMEEITDDAESEESEESEEETAAAA